LPRLADKRLGPMIFWSIAIAITAIACAALFYAGGRRAVNAAGPETPNANSHFSHLLAEIDADLANGRLAPDQATMARKELAREVMRAGGVASVSNIALGRGQLVGGLVGVAAIAFGIYAVLGSPDQPSLPLAKRPEILAQDISLEDAIVRIEQRLAEAPDDARGWSVIAPAYVQLGRYDDAVAAYRRVLDLSGENSETETDLAEALLLAAGGDGSPEAMDILRKIADADGEAARARLYLAAELMRTGDYEEAAERWQQAIDLAQGDEAWLTAARQGLAVAQAGGVDTAAEQQAEMIQQMVGGLSDRLFSDGGTVQEWIQLIRSYLVLGDRDSAQKAYGAAVAAYPAAFDRGEMDTLAFGAGLTLNGGTP
jgi:cytochrome c-type biogenesis protein CcmH